MRVLLISPDTGFTETHEQIQDIVTALRPTPLLGTVTRYDVTRALNAAQYDVIWMACHGGPGGIELSDGPMSGDTLAQLLRGHPLKLIYLNTCSNAQVALDLHDATSAPVICTINPVDVHTAYFSGATLARYLSGGMTARMAFEMSRPGHDTTYRMIGGGERESRDRLDLVLEMLSDIREDLRGVQELAQTNARRLDSIESQITPSMAHAMAWSVGYWIFVAIFPITFYDVRSAAGLTAQSGILVIVLLAAIAYVPLSRALRMELWDL